MCACADPRALSGLSATLFGRARPRNTRTVGRRLTGKNQGQVIKYNTQRTWWTQCFFWSKQFVALFLFLYEIKSQVHFIKSSFYRKGWLLHNSCDCKYGLSMADQISRRRTTRLVWTAFFPGADLDKRMHASTHTQQTKPTGHISLLTLSSVSQFSPPPPRPTRPTTTTSNLASIWPDLSWFTFPQQIVNQSLSVPIKQIFVFLIGS